MNSSYEEKESSASNKEEKDSSAYSKKEEESSNSNKDEKESSSPNKEEKESSSANKDKKESSSSNKDKKQNSSSNKKVEESSIKEELEISKELVTEKIITLTGNIIIHKYYKGRLLGKGGFAKCYEFSSNENKKIFAGKVFVKSDIIKQKRAQKLVSEIKIHKSLHHPHIVALEHFFEDSNNVYILLEMCQNQTLHELLKRRKRLTELEVQCYIVQLIDALKYIHSNKVIHRDLKLSNLFLTDKMELKVGDFGLSSKIEFEGERKMTSCGTPNYMAPEILNKKGHSYEVDIWSLGVIIYTLLIGKTPYESNHKKTTFKKILYNNYTFPDDVIISEAAKNLITQILVLEPKKRPSLDQILTHDFFHLGTSIPKLLPSSTIACIPSISYIKQFMPEVGKDGIVHKQVTTTNLVSKSNNIIESNENEKENKNINNYPDNKNLKEPDIWIKKYRDFSPKYILGYILNNGFCGVYFQDNSKIILNPDNKKFYYIEKKSDQLKEESKIYNLDNYPDELKAKVTILNEFTDYFLNIFKKPLESKIEDKEENIIQPYTYVKSWKLDRFCYIFRLTNKVVQVRFIDKTQIIISIEDKIVVYVNKKKERKIYYLVNILETQNFEIIQRLSYIKQIFINMLNEIQSKNKEKNNIKNNNISSNIEKEN